jgi:hypothetical protein
MFPDLLAVGDIPHVQRNPTDETQLMFQMVPKQGLKSKATNPRQISGAPRLAVSWFVTPINSGYNDYLYNYTVPSGKLSHNYGESPCYQWVNPLFLWAIFNSYVDITRGYIITPPSILVINQQTANFGATPYVINARYSCYKCSTCYVIF